MQLGLETGDDPDESDPVVVGICCRAPDQK